MKFDDFDINNYKLTRSSKHARLSQEDVKAMLWLYYETNVPVWMIYRSFGIDRRTLYHHIHKHGLEVRDPRLGNRTNHPTNFEKSLRAAYRKEVAKW